MSDTQLNRARKILEAAHNSAVSEEGRCRIEQMQIHVGYSEPGYGTGYDIIVTGDFNSCTSWNNRQRTVVDDIPERVANVLNAAGIAIEWSDEWAECSGCNRLVRTQADHYGWTPSFVQDEDGLTCEECMKDNPEEHLANLEGNANTANTLRIHPEEHGYVCLGEFERGFHSGQDDDPRLVAQALEEELGLERWLFNIDSVGQFDTRFSLWLHEDELSESQLDRDELRVYCERKAVGPSVSAALKRGLEYASIKNVSAEDFINGKL